MNYFKHYSNARHSNSIRELQRLFGFEGLGRYWTFIEFLSERWKSYDDDPIFEIQREELRDLFRFRSWNGLRLFTDHLATIPGLLVEQNGNVYEINAPILLELKARDFKSARSQRHKVAPKSKEKRVKSNNIKNNKKDFLTDDMIEPLYSQYPKKTGKASGYDKMKKVIKNEKDLEVFKQCLANYLDLCQKEGREKKYIKNWSAFVNQHLDFVEAEDFSETAGGSKEKKLTENLKSLWNDVEQGKL